ncbi:hypothetical protein AMD27_17260 (plasmid) [Acinetobacter sp. TGL-Y2]|uniref:hypothetical protein n=1 Tax=Acinetobacter sp. TGL-Y2 TaxID=1407071 RepID=UPI0007A68026|nr:hypothetical protein [Acinetobacter sp. TGL-Y2]AMW80666.1 hypothetical protein AMD27_17260 [Acinetobacter sp. TGL-Y2]
MINSTDVFNAVAAQLTQSGWVTRNDKEIEKPVNEKQTLIMRVCGTQIDMRLSLTSNYTSIHFNDHSKDKLNQSSKLVIKQMASFERDWLNA